MQKDDILTVKIEKLSNLAKGIAKYEGQVIFIENVCPEDEVKIQITKVNKNYATAKVIEILTPSSHRIKPFCPLQNICGSCQLQFIDYQYQLELKQQIVEDAIKSIAKLNTPINFPIPSPQIKAFRHKTQCPVTQTKVSKKLLAGYYKTQSHEIVNIKYCPIQPKLCDNIIEYIREIASTYNVSGYNEKKHSGLLRHVVIRVSSDTGQILVTLVINDTKVSKNIKHFANDIFNNFDEVVGVCVNFNNKKTNLILTDNTELICGQDYIEEKLCDITFRIGSNTFFQVNPKSAENIFKYVKNYIKDNFDKPTIFDAYAGIATFGIVMSDIAHKVVSVEENEQSIKIANDVLKINNINNVELHAMDTAKYLENTPEKFDITILDPPRKGCSIESLDRTLEVTKSKIIYVSCNPQTLIRDLEYLISKGAKVSFIQPFDMFCHSYHVECVTIIDVE